MNPKDKDHTINIFQNIALNFSGGGFRAAAFTLGVLSYLDHFQFEGGSLLKKVKGLSTVSGGTISGAAYAVSSARGESFDAFFRGFYHFLKGDDLLRAALSKMEDQAVWASTNKRQSLINAFSLAYEEHLTVEKLSFLMENKSHLEDICFNATEFSFGLAFRFQQGGDFGNYQLKSKELNGARGEFKIADAIASSSCFPMGFAPMIMPDDYLSHQSGAYKALKALKVFEKGVGIMDGGIVDNQGIGSTMRADERRKEDGYDLVLGCDVASYMMEPWQPASSGDGSQLTLRALGRKVGAWVRGGIWKWLFIALGLGLTYLGVDGRFPQWSELSLYFGGIFLFMGIALFMVSSLIVIGTKIGLWVLKYMLSKWVPPFFLKKVSFLDDLKLSLLKRMLEERASSTFKMVNEVFLKQIRRLNYNLFFESERLKNRRALVLIYQLTRDQFKAAESTEIEGTLKDLEIKPPSDKIFDVAQTAYEMGTTLWFSPEDEKVKRLNSLIACGQFSVCYSLIYYLAHLKAEETNMSEKQISEIRQSMGADWDLFRENPMHLIPGWAQA